MDTRHEKVFMNTLALAAATFMGFFVSTPAAAAKFHAPGAPWLVPLVGGGCGLIAGAMPAFMNRLSDAGETAHKNEKPIEAFARLGWVGLAAGLATLFV